MFHIVVNISADSIAEIGRGEFQFTSTKGRPDQVFSDYSRAVKHATQQATENPLKQFAVFSLVEVFETAKPKVITKKFNDSGELVLSEDKAK